MAKTVAVFPNPYLKDEWSTVMHPLLSTWAGSLKQAGWNVIGLNADDIFNTDLLKNMGPDAIIIHWSETLTTFFINRHPPGRILTSRLSRIIPLSIRKSIANSITDSVKLMIDEWSCKLADSKIRVFNQIHELVSHSFNEPGLSECDAYLKKKIFELYTAFLTQEESSVQLVKNIYSSEKPYTITFLGDYTKFHGGRIPKNEAREILSLKKDLKIISYIGTARKNRNPADVVKCFNNIAKENDCLIVAGVGVGKYVPAKSENIKIFDELLPNEKLRNIFCASDYVINDAHEYMTSAVVRTAISYHIPVIVRNYGASIKMAKEAVIFIEDKNDGLENAINYALNLANEKYDMLVKAAELRNEERPWSQYGKAFDDLFSNLSKK